MKVLMVCSYRYYAPYTEHIAPFIYEQAKELRKLGVEIKYYIIKGGWKGYVKAIWKLRQAISSYKPDIVHAHSGLCCFVASLQRSKVPVISTFHGSDIHNHRVRVFSYYAMRHSNANFFVSQQMLNMVSPVSNAAVIPCGVDTNEFHYMDMKKCRQLLGWTQDKIYILFSKEFSDVVKNYPLAKAAVSKIPNSELVELYGYNRQQMVWLYNACDCALMTSFTEGSPQFVKEAVACGCPVVSTDVGDVSEVIAGIKNCKITSYDVENVVFALQSMMNIGHSEKPQLNDRYLADTIAQKIFKIYEKSIK